ncbi:MAG TPA: CvpA family protein [Candidatus Angelobacter sp.]|nr:CvpA family protein [Candidatus Angelobacter sp.]
MNALDWIILVIMLFSALLAAAQGFFFEIICLAGSVFGFLLASWGYSRLAPWFLPYVKLPAFADLAGFFTIFISIVLLAGAIARITRWVVHEVGLRSVDRVLGAAFGFLRGMVIVTAGLMAITAFAPGSDELSGSQLAGYFLVAGQGASWLAPSEVRQKFRAGIIMLRGGPNPGATKKQ